jgi:type VI secretion system secreted protein Hcp
MSCLSVERWWRVSGSLLFILAVVVGVNLWVPPLEEAEAGAIEIEEELFAGGDPTGGSQMFLEIPAIPNINPNPDHHDQIELLGFNWGDDLPGISRSASQVGSAGGGGSGSTEAHDFHFIKRVDFTSPSLMVACARGERFGTVIMRAHLNSVPPGPGHHDYLQIILTEASCTSFALGGPEDQYWPREHVTFNFAEIEMVFQEDDGSPESQGDYNVQTGR